MSRYSGKQHIIEAYQFGSSNIPEWVSQAIKKDRIIASASPGSYTIQGWLVQDKGAVSTAAIGDYIINTDGSFSVMPKTKFEAQYLFDEADIISIKGVDRGVMTGVGTVASPYVITIGVPNAVTAIIADDIIASVGATVKLKTGSTFDTDDSDQSISLTAGTAVDIYITVVSAGETLTTYYKASVTRAAT